MPFLPPNQQRQSTEGTKQYILLLAKSEAKKQVQCTSYTFAPNTEQNLLDFIISLPYLPPSIHTAGQCCHEKTSLNGVE